jgi:uncharacterized OsmC-like protein
MPSAPSASQCTIVSSDTVARKNGLKYKDLDISLKSGRMNKKKMVRLAYIPGIKDNRTAARVAAYSSFICPAPASWWISK